MGNAKESVTVNNEMGITPDGNITKIQFIGACMSTTPSHLESIENMSDRGYYAGLDTTEADITARLTFLQKLITKAVNSEKIDPTALKIFVIPEFFFRGKDGAYFNTEENASKFFGKYFASFTYYLSHSPQLDNWIFVLGSLLTAKDSINKEIEPTKELYPIGNHLLYIYDKLKSSKDCGIELPPLHEFLKVLDLYQEGDSATQDSILRDFPQFATVLRCTLDYCDSKADICVDNSCFIVTREPNTLARVIRCQKKYKSKEDFVLNSVFMKKSKPIETGYLQSITKYAEIKEKDNEIKDNDLDEYAVFDYKGIRFGIDICLDHSRKRLLKHLSKSNHIDVQIIPSCGMEIKYDAVIARKDGYVFNCDGEYVQGNPKWSNDGVFSHTSLRKVTEPIPKSGGAATLGDCLRETTVKVPLTNDEMELFPQNRCDLHIYNAELI